MKVKTVSDISNVSTWEELKRFSSVAIRDIIDVVNGNLSPTDNLLARLLTVTFSSANVEVQVPHTLGKVPSGYILVGSNAALSLYDGDTANTDSLVYIKSSATGSARVLIF